MDAEPGTPEYVDHHFALAGIALANLAGRIADLERQVDNLNKTILLLCTPVEHSAGAH